jgi:outer membrane protein TolC
LSKYPGFSLGYKLENELGNYFNGFSIGLTIPLFSQRHKVEAVSATQKAINLQNSAFEIERLCQLKVQRANAIALYQEMLEYKPILENHNNINLLKKALDGGQINLITYIQEVNFFLEAQQDYIDVEYRYHQALASLNRYALLEI